MSTNGSSWTTLLTSSSFLSWPGHSFIPARFNTSGNTYFRITISRDATNTNPVAIYSISLPGSYGNESNANVVKWNSAKVVSVPAGISTTGGRIVLRDNAIEEHATNGGAAIAVNYVGYQGGTTQFRNFNVYNGKNLLIFSLDGSTQAATFSGTVRSETSFSSGSQGNYIGANNHYWRIGSNSGYVDIGNGNGPGDTSYLHFTTGQTKFYFNTQVDVNGPVSIYGTNTYMSSSGLGCTNFLADSNGIAISDYTAHERYARLALTRSFTTGSRQYISLVKSGTYPWGIGMNASGTLIFGQANGGIDSEFVANKLELTTSGNLWVPGNVTAPSLESTNNGTSGGLIMRDAGGTRYRLYIDGGNLKLVAV